MAPGSVAEDGATNLVYTFTRNGVISSAVDGELHRWVEQPPLASHLTTTRRLAQRPSLPPAGTVTFSAGSSTATVTVDPEADSTVEPDETVILTVTAGVWLQRWLAQSCSYRHDHQRRH